MNAKEKDRQERIEKLREIVKPGDTVYTLLRHVSRSGMYRVISLYVMKDNAPVWLDGYAAPLLEGYDERHEGCKAGGCGMDMGFHLVYNLSYALYPTYPCQIKIRPNEYRPCASPDHVNRGREEWESGDREHRDGYALKHQWM